LKIKIITYYFTNNYGAQLQALSLYYFLKSNLSKLIEVSFFSYQPKKLIQAEVYGVIKTRNPIKFIWGLIRIFKFFLWKKKYNLPYPRNKSTYGEINIYGSDEIWNFKNRYFKNENYLFGEGNPFIKISYGTSFGWSILSKYEKKQNVYIGALIRSFFRISVRDKSSYFIVKKISRRKSKIVVDPTLLLNFYFLKKIKKREQKKYAIVYGTVFSAIEIKKIKEYCLKRKVKIISIGYYNSWADKNIIYADPKDFIEYLKGSTIVFTSMFHGVVLSTKFKKNFWFTIDPIRKNKLEYFIKKLNIKNRLLNENVNFDLKPNYLKINKILNKWILYSRKFLLESINKSIFNTNNINKFR
jgi:hypothetical protein